jgi:hypothetical protein
MRTGKKTEPWKSKSEVFVNAEQSGIQHT